MTTTACRYILLVGEGQGEVEVQVPMVCAPDGTGVGTAPPSRLQVPAVGGRPAEGAAAHAAGGNIIIIIKYLFRSKTRQSKSHLRVMRE
jgi:hypothetical protein